MTDATIKPRVPVYKKEGTYEAPPPSVLNGSAKVEDLPKIIGSSASGATFQEVRRPDASSTALIDAVQKVYAAVTARIAYHDREAARLRESLKPFAAHAPRQIAAQSGELTEDDIRALANLAAQLTPNGEQKP